MSVKTRCTNKTIYISRLSARIANINAVARVVVNSVVVNLTAVVADADPYRVVVNVVVRRGRASGDCDPRAGELAVNAVPRDENVAVG